MPQASIESYALATLLLLLHDFVKELERTYCHNHDRSDLILQ